MWCFWRKKKKNDQVVEPLQPTVEETVVENETEEMVQEEPEYSPEIEETTEEDVEAVDELEEAEEEQGDKPEVKVNYHVSLNNDENSKFYKMWRVRKEKSAKTIKYFRTQKEAIDYAKGLAARNETRVIIHKVDGKIRKQDYSKKD